MTRKTTKCATPVELGLGSTPSLIASALGEALPASNGKAVTGRHPDDDNPAAPREPA